MSSRPGKPDPARFITANMRLTPVPAVPEILLYAAHPGSGLWRLVGRRKKSAPPYWAYRWAGGTVLARHILDRPETVMGRHVLDLGSGSGIVGIAAAKAGARQVTASDVDPNAIVATKLNAAANGAEIAALPGDLTGGGPPAVDLIVVGDLFYDGELAARVTRYLDACETAGIEILIGDPGRAHLPHERLRLVTEYTVPDFGEAGEGVSRPSAVYAFGPKQA